MKAIRLTFGVSAALLSLALAISACGGESDPADAANADSETGDTASSGGDPITLADVEACSILSGARAAELLGVTPADIEVTSGHIFGADETWYCNYGGEKDTGSEFGPESYRVQIHFSFVDSEEVAARSMEEELEVNAMAGGLVEGATGMDVEASRGYPDLGDGAVYSGLHGTLKMRVANVFVVPSVDRPSDQPEFTMDDRIALAVELAENLR